MPAQQFLSLTRFCTLYGYPPATVKRYIKKGIYKGWFDGHRWFIHDPGYEIAQALGNPQLAMYYAPLLRTGEVCIILNRCRDTIRAHRERGNLKGVKIGPNEWRYSVANLDDLIYGVRKNAAVPIIRTGKRKRLRKELIDWVKAALPRFHEIRKRRHPGLDKIEAAEQQKLVLAKF